MSLRRLSVWILFAMFVEATNGKYFYDYGGYCKKKYCEKLGHHTMCKYPWNTLACPGKSASFGLTHEMRKLLLDKHNSLRQRIALGNEPGQPPASNMMKLYWNTELETIAQRWANQCLKEHDECRRTIDNAGVGQNAAFYGYNAKSPNITDQVVSPIQWFYNEVSRMPKDAETLKKAIGDFQYLIDVTGDDWPGHYTEVVWAEVTQLGCGYTRGPADANGNQPVSLYCNYKPSANLLGAPIYKIGQACNDCPGTAKCSARWDGLCTDEKDEYKDLPDAAVPSSPSTLPMICVALYVICVESIRL